MSALPRLNAGFLPLETTRWSPEARRLASFLGGVARYLDEQTTIKIYGSAAVAFYTATATDSAHMTEDIDVGAPGKIAPTLESARARAGSMGIDFHFRAPGMWLAVPDWPDYCVDVTSRLKTDKLCVELMHPVDLIVSKMIRWNERDAEDANRLRDVIPIDVEVFAARLNQAVEQSMVTNWHKLQLSEILEELFIDRDELAKAREMTPALRPDEPDSGA